MVMNSTENKWKKPEERKKHPGELLLKTLLKSYKKV